MEHDPQNHHGNIPHPSAEFGNVQNNSAPFRTVQNDAENFGSVQQIAERKESHTLTVREAARMFEGAGVARTERSIVNWCQPNRTGIARLDSYFDPNERRYYISPQSVEHAIVEEKAKATKINDPLNDMADVRNNSEKTVKRAAVAPEGNMDRFQELEKEVLDWKILNKGKDFFVEQLQKERNALLDQVISASRKVGELETKLLQIEPPTHPQNHIEK